MSLKIWVFAGGLPGQAERLGGSIKAWGVGRGAVLHSLDRSVDGSILRLGVTRGSYVAWLSISTGTGTIKLFSLA